jgi:hypothetical protein
MDIFSSFNYFLIYQQTQNLELIDHKILFAMITDFDQELLEFELPGLYGEVG